MKEPFLMDWANISEMFKDFHEPEQALELLYAAYRSNWCDGQATVVYRQNGDLYLVEGNHCSCNGLEECWAPTKTSAEALKMMPARDYLPQWAEFLETLL